MSRVITILAVAAVFAGFVSAASGASIVLKDEKKLPAYEIISETLSGINWNEAEVDNRGRKKLKGLGKRIYIWQVQNVRYDNEDMDQYNGLQRTLEGGRGSKLAKGAESFLGNSPQPRKMPDDEWARIQLQCQYFYAQGLFLQNKYDAAIDEFIKYLIGAEDAAKTAVSRALQSGSFQSVVSGKVVKNTSSLNRFYLDALEALGLAYLKKGEIGNAMKKAFGPLQKATEAMKRPEFIDWSLRSLRSAAEYAESTKNYADARKSYEEYEKVALRKNSGKPSRTSIEAGLKVGYMLVADDDTRKAKARFSKAIKSWENSLKALEKNPAAPKKNWVTSDIAFQTSGAYVGQGLVFLKTAKSSADYSNALDSFSKSIALFNADSEIRSMALLGAARASQKLHAGAKTEIAKKMYGKWAAKYLHELESLHADSKSAGHDWIADIKKVAAKFS